MLMRCYKKISRRAFHRASGGFTLIEVAITLIVLAFLAGSVPAAMLAVSNAHFRANEMRLAENLTRNEFEYIKSQEYKPGNVTYPVQYNLVNVDTAGFGFHVDAWPIDPETSEKVGISTVGEITLYDHDYGIQLITVSVYGFRQRPGESGVKPLLVSTDYKVDRRLSP
jgi:prepilin-type N-terminal cleavage/methylation domain-containing protein